ncbi:synaptogyrin [Bradysia coprophila]|uniref:synaptogyrin n=1 Tax=Bradysia coprophila TaxID=38358 RepID=UPI00187D937E|nr:synaptogyrin [Bradysia coprophila]
MDVGGAFGGGKAGAPFNPILFVQRPQVFLRALCWLFAIVVFGCISSEGWTVIDGKDSCLYNDNSNACNYGVGIGVIAFLASMGFIVGEYLFEQMSSVKTRKHFVLGDLGFSSLWAFLYFVGFCYLTNQWGKAKEPPNGYGVNNVQAAIVFSLFSIVTWAGCAWFAYQRYKQGVDAAFAPTYESDPTANAYSSYPVGNVESEQYNEPPFGQQQQQQRGEYPAPNY